MWGDLTMALSSVLSSMPRGEMRVHCEDQSALLSVELQAFSPRTQELEAGVAV